MQASKSTITATLALIRSEISAPHDDITKRIRADDASAAIHDLYMANLVGIRSNGVVHLKF